jgi:hypothetical protein
MKSVKNIIALVCLYMLSACEEKPLVIPDFVPPTSGKVVLIEEFTGASCTGCPQGAAKVEELLNLLPNNVAAVAIHGVFLSEPIANKSKYDFRNEDAAVLEQEPSFALQSKPAAMIDRSEVFPGQPIIKDSPPSWGIFVEELLKEDQELELSIDAIVDNGVLEVTVFGTALVGLPGNYNLGVYVTQSHIIDYQKTTGSTIPDFEFNHFLRKSLTNVPYGNVIDSDLLIGDSFERNFTFTLPTDLDPMIPEWKVEDLEVVAYVSRDGGTVAPIIQAAKKKL